MIPALRVGPGKGQRQAPVLLWFLLLFRVGLLPAPPFPSCNGCALCPRPLPCSQRMCGSGLLHLLICSGPQLKEVLLGLPGLSTALCSLWFRTATIATFWFQIPKTPDYPLINILPMLFYPSNPMSHPESGALCACPLFGTPNSCCFLLNSFPLFPHACVHPSLKSLLIMATDPQATFPPHLHIAASRPPALHFLGPLTSV